MEQFNLKDKLEKKNIIFEDFSNRNLQNIQQINPTYDPSIIEELNLENNNLTSIDGIENFTSLNTLHLENNSINELKPLLPLKKLERLYLRRNKITEIKDINNLNHLKVLDLSENEISKISSLSELIELEVLDLGHNKIKEVNELDNLLNLRYLNLQNNLVEECNGFPKLINLRVLYLSKNSLKVIPNFRALKNLKALMIEENKIQRIENLDLLLNLNLLSLSKNEIYEVDGSKLPISLTEIYLDQNNIKNVKNFSKTPNLNKLKLNSNKIEKINFTSDLGKFQFIEEINLSKNNINDISDLTEVEALKFFRISNNHIKDISPIKNLKNLKRIYIDNNPIINLESLEQMLSLRKIFVDQHLLDLYLEYCNNLNLIDNELIATKIKFLKKLILNPSLHSSESVISKFSLKETIESYNWFIKERSTLTKIDLKNIIINTQPFKLNRLTIFIGKNNTGKTNALREIHNFLKNLENLNQNNLDIEIMPQKNRNLLNKTECYYIPKDRKISGIKQEGPRADLDDIKKPLIDLLDNGLQNHTGIFEIKDLTIFLDAFNNTEEEIDTYSPQKKDLLILLYKILNNWCSTLNKFFKDINFVPPEKITPKSLKFNFILTDTWIPDVSYKLTQIGSGTQELVYLIFIIELLKYLPNLNDFKNNSLNNFNPPPRILCIDEPDISLHPSLQKEFFDYLIDASKRLQIIITTQTTFIPKILKNPISVILFYKDKEEKRFNYKFINNNNQILIQDELFSWNGEEIAFYLSKNKYEYFKSLDYDSSDFTMGSFIIKRFMEDDNYLGLLKLGTVERTAKDSLLQNVYFLSFKPNYIDLNDKLDNIQIYGKELRVFIVQLNIIPEEVRSKLIKKKNRCSKREKSNLRKNFLYCTNWDKKFLEKSVLCYSEDQQKSTCVKITGYLDEIKKDLDKMKKTLILFPENSLPYKILPTLLEFSKHNGVVIIGGMEHCTLEAFRAYINHLDEDLKVKYKDPIEYEKLEAYPPLTNTSYINQAVIINTDKNFTFQIKNIPVYFNSIYQKEGISIILKPTFKKIQTAIGVVAVLICKDLLVHADIIDNWMDLHNIQIIATPSFTDLVNPFRNKLGDIISHKPQKDKEDKNKIFIFANVAEYGGSGAYSYENRRDFEPNRRSLFPPCDRIDDDDFRPSIEGKNPKECIFKYS